MPHSVSEQDFTCDETVVMRGLSDFQSWESLAGVHWDKTEISEVYSLKHTVLAMPVTEPRGVRARVLPPGDPLREKYVDWSKPFVAGQLLANPEVWETAFAEHNERVPARLLTWLKEGYSVYIDKQELNYQPNQNRLSSAEHAFAAQVIERDWVGMGVVEEIPEHRVHTKAIVCNVVVAYRDGKMERVCWSGKPVNVGVADRPFKMEQLSDIMKLMRPGDVAFSLDFEKGFFQFRLKEGVSRLLVFQFNGKFYRWRVLPFGLKSAPAHFSWVVKQVLRLLRTQGISCSFFIDDLIFLASSYEELFRIRAQVLDLFYKLGMRVSLKKSLLTGGDLLRHLGMDLCLVDGSIWVPVDKVMQAKALCASLLAASSAAVSGFSVASVVGKLQSFRLACPLVMILSKGLSRCLTDLPVLEAGGDWESKDYSAKIHLSALAIAELRFWCACLWHIRGCALDRPVESLVFTDASTTGFGYVATNALNAATATGFKVREVCGGEWKDRCVGHSTAFELYTILLMLRQCKERLAGKRVHVCTDNVGAAFVLPKGCNHNHMLHAWALAVWGVATRWNIRISAQYLAGDGIVSSGADGLSRGHDPYNCTLKSDCFAKVWAWNGPFEVDAFSGPSAVQKHPHTGEQLSCVSPFAMPLRLHCDALTFITVQSLYAFPPPGMLLKYIKLVMQHSLRCVIVVPQWPTALWWPLVAVREQLRLGKVGDCVRPGRFGLAHPFGQAFDLEQALDTTLVAVAFSATE